MNFLVHTKIVVVEVDVDEVVRVVVEVVDVHEVVEFVVAVVEVVVDVDEVAEVCEVVKVVVFVVEVVADYVYDVAVDDDDVFDVGIDVVFIQSQYLIPLPNIIRVIKYRRMGRGGGTWHVWKGRRDVVWESEGLGVDGRMILK